MYSRYLERYLLLQNFRFAPPMGLAALLAELRKKSPSVLAFRAPTPSLTAVFDTEH